MSQMWLYGLNALILAIVLVGLWWYLHPRTKAGIKLGAGALLVTVGILGAHPTTRPMIIDASGVMTMGILGSQDKDTVLDRGDIWKLHAILVQEFEPEQRTLLWDGVNPRTKGLTEVHATWADQVQTDLAKLNKKSEQSRQGFGIYLTNVVKKMGSWSHSSAEVCFYLEIVAGHLDGVWEDLPECPQEFRSFQKWVNSQNHNGTVETPKDQASPDYGVFWEAVREYLELRKKGMIPPALPKKGKK